MANNRRCLCGSSRMQRCEICVLDVVLHTSALVTCATTGCRALRRSSIVVKVQVPGVNKDDIQLTITENALTVKGETKEESKKEDKNYHRQEFHYGAFVRTVALPVPVQAEKVAAQLKDGVLEVTMPKSAQAQVKHIPI